jgi:hypothetical protein
MIRGECGRVQAMEAPYSVESAVGSNDLWDLVAKRNREVDEVSRA